MLKIRSIFLLFNIIFVTLGCEKEKPKISINYSILRQWKPHNISNSFGADVLLEDDLSKEGIISFIKQLGRNKNPVVILVFTSRIAYEQQNNNNFGEEYKKGYLLHYIKNNQRGTNEIRWFQEIGEFSHLFGQKTKLQ